MTPSETELDELVVYFNASPAAVDRGTPNSSPPIPPSLPENLRQLLTAKETAQHLWTIGTSEFRLSLDQIREISRMLRDILLGEMSARELSQAIQRRAGTSPETAHALGARLTKEFITAHYFQIAQVYEKKHGRQAVGSGHPTPPTGLRGTEQAVGMTTDEATGAPLRPLDFAGQGSEPHSAEATRGGQAARVDVTPPAPAAPPPATPPPAAPAAPPQAAPPRVVDLRNGAIPSRLPPPPRVAPGGAKWGPPRVAPPPSAPRPAGNPQMPPGVPLERLSPPPPPPGPPPPPPPAPTLPARPPGGGAHGPLPTPP
ncbi:MAG: formin-like protein 20-like [Parcubacteria group bacterium Gr01-1014_38]|nr:MAG: formin-like protein 20-like [Parcubacteria group bacterium Gr01-1014_38]